jgi:predicted esterase
VGLPNSPSATTLTLDVPFRLLAVPPRDATSGPPPVLLALHGYAMDAETMQGLVLRFAPPGFFVIVVEGPHSTYVPGEEGAGAAPRTGFHWGVSPRAVDNRSMHRRAVAAALQWAIGHGGDPARVSLVGFSQPCSFNYRLALDPPHGHAFRAIVAICGGIPGEWKADEPGTDASKATAVLHISTKEDTFYTLERVAPFRERLAARFGAVTHSLYEGGHRIPSAANEEIRKFLVAQNTRGRETMGA